MISTELQRFFKLCIVLLFVFPLIAGCKKNQPQGEIPKQHLEKICEGSKCTWIRQGEASDVVLAPSGEFYAVATTIGVYLYDVENSNLLALIDHPAESIAFHPNEKLLAFSDRDSIFIWDVDSDTVTEFVTNNNFRKGHTKWITDIEFSPNGKFLAYETFIFEAACDALGRAFRLLNVESGDIIFERKLCLHWRDSVFAFSEDSKNLILGWNDYLPSKHGGVEYLDIIDIESGGVLRSIEDQLILSASGDGRTVAILDYESKAIQIWDVNKRGYRGSILEGYIDVPRQVTISPDGKVIVYNHGVSSYINSIMPRGEPCSLGSFLFETVTYSKDNKLMLLWDRVTQRAFFWEIKNCRFVQEWTFGD